MSTTEKEVQLKEKHHNAIDELNRAAVHVSDAARNAVERLRNSEPSNKNISAMQKLRHTLENAFDAIEELAKPDEK
jgi:predicted N-acetyltransferase YhbS